MQSNTHQGLIRSDIDRQDPARNWSNLVVEEIEHAGAKKFRAGRLGLYDGGMESEKLMAKGTKTSRR